MFADAAAEGMPPFQNAGGDCNGDKAVPKIGKETIDKNVALILMARCLGTLLTKNPSHAFKTIKACSSVTNAFLTAKVRKDEGPFTCNSEKGFGHFRFERFCIVQR